MSKLLGIHHVTAFAGDPLRNDRFYTNVLGLRRIKKTVNFDAPDIYHLYFGNHAGSPGTVVTFFPEELTPSGRPGAGEFSLTAFGIPAGSIDGWRDRLASNDVKTRDATLFDRPALLLDDPDAMPLALIESEKTSSTQDITGIDSVTLRVADARASRAFFREILGFAGGDDASVFTLDDGGPGKRIVIDPSPTLSRTRLGAGLVHHVAFRVADDKAQLEMRDRLTRAGVGVSPVMDRNYFHSIYFREPGGIVIEIATDGPGFDIDEPMESLGTDLKLPAQYEFMRQRLLKTLKPI